MANDLRIVKESSNRATGTTHRGDHAAPEIQFGFGVSFRFAQE
jgi:hypothetical protein